MDKLEKKIKDMYVRNLDSAVVGLKSNYEKIFSQATSISCPDASKGRFGKDVIDASYAAAAAVGTENIDEFILVYKNLADSVSEDMRKDIPALLKTATNMYFAVTTRTLLKTINLALEDEL